jgi:hypothetical protein
MPRRMMITGEVMHTWQLFAATRPGRWAVGLFAGSLAGFTVIFALVTCRTRFRGFTTTEADDLSSLMAR